MIVCVQKPAEPADSLVLSECGKFLDVVGDERFKGFHSNLSLSNDLGVLPSTDETQSGTLARVISLNKPYATTAPMEGLTAQTLESGGGMLFTNKQMLKQQVVELACNEGLRMDLGNKLKTYLDEVVSWDVVARQYNEAYRLARKACKTNKPIELPLEF